MQQKHSYLVALFLVINYLLPTTLLYPSQAEIVSIPSLTAYSSSLIQPYAEQAMQALQDYQGTASKILPSALSSLSSSMKTPYVLLIASTGTCLAYVMTGASKDPLVSPERLIGITQDHMLQLGAAALSGFSYGAGSQVKKNLERQLTSYAKPILLAGSLGGLVLVNTTMSNEDTPYLMAILNNTLLGLLPDLLGEFPDVGKKIKGLFIEAEKKPAHVNPASVIKNKAAKNLWRKKVQRLKNLITSDYVVALIAFGTVITIQTQQEGALDESDQMLAIATLTSATQLIQKTVVGDYALRASENVCDTVLSGLSKAAHFSKRVYQTCKEQFSSWLFPQNFNQESIAD